MQRLDEKHSFDETGRAALSDILVRTKREAYGKQKKGIAAIFKKYASAQKMVEDDLLFMRTVVREFTTRADRKIRKHRMEIDQTAQKLDFRKAAQGSVSPDEQDDIYAGYTAHPRKLRAV